MQLARKLALKVAIPKGGRARPRARGSMPSEAGTGTCPTTRADCLVTAEGRQARRASSTARTKSGIS